MFYFEHYLSTGGVRELGSVSILRTTDEAWVYETLREEILDTFPAAQITVDAEAALPARTDLLVAPVMGAYEFPFHDVLYEQLAVLDRVLRHRHRARHVMIYRARWREVEVIASASLPALVRKRRLEGRMIRACRQSALLRRLLRPRYPS